jgi:hypothetical protein
MSPVVLLLGIVVVIAVAGVIFAVIEDDIDRRRTLRIKHEIRLQPLDLRRWKR